MITNSTENIQFTKQLIHFSTLTTANRHLRVLRCDLIESQGPSTIIVIRIGMTPTLGAIKFALSL